jgi:urease accessory protein
MDTLSLIHGLRFVDSFFPSGGYAFSSGLEAAVQEGAVRNAEDLFHYVEDLMRHGLGRREAVAARLACQAAAAGTLSLAFKVDRELDAMKIGCESRLASRQMGRQVAKIACDRMTEPVGLLKEYQAEIDHDQTPGHFAVALGLTLGTCGWTREQTISVFLYQTAVGFVSAAMKLLPIGQREGQRLLERWMPLIGRISREAAAKKDMTSWVPVQDIYGMRHSRLEWRLFRS